MTEPTNVSNVNPFAPTTNVSVPSVASKKHPARWLLITIGCLLVTPLMGAIMSIRSGPSRPNVMPIMIIYGVITLLSFVLALTPFRAWNRRVSILYGITLGGVVPLTMCVMTVARGTNLDVLITAAVITLFFLPVTLLSVFRQYARSEG